jgi:hypothetical protein
MGSDSGLGVLGGHCYLGGFLIGLQEAGFEVISSLEKWKPGLIGATKLGLPSENFESRLKSLPGADLVVGNPPCSRFSHLSLSFFKKEAYLDIKTFPEILELAEIAKKSKAQILWWETGPLAYSIGEPLIYNFHQFLVDNWGPTTTLVVKVDLRYLGIPQKRPRNHIIHFRGLVNPPSLPGASWPIEEQVGNWLKNILKNRGLKYPVRPTKRLINNPLQWVSLQNKRMTFRSMVPKIVSSHDLNTNAVISRRVMIWLEENRFFDLLEYSALMTYPIKKIEDLIKSDIKVEEVQVLLSKSVAPVASSWVAEKIIKPWLAGDNQAGEVKPFEKYQNFWKAELTITPRLERNLRIGQKLIFK